MIKSHPEPKGNNMWSVVKTTGTPPAPRWGHVAVMFRGVMHLFGGKVSTSAAAAFNLFASFLFFFSFFLPTLLSLILL